MVDSADLARHDQGVGDACEGVLPGAGGRVGAGGRDKDRARDFPVDAVAVRVDARSVWQIKVALWGTRVFTPVGWLAVEVDPARRTGVEPANARDALVLSVVDGAHDV